MYHKDEKQGTNWIPLPVLPVCFPSLLRSDTSCAVFTSRNSMRATIAAVLPDVIVPLSQKEKGLCLVIS